MLRPLPGVQRYTALCPHPSRDPRGGTSALGPLAPLSSPPARSRCASPPRPSGVPAAPDQPATAVGNLPPPPPSSGFQGRQVQCPRRLFIFSLASGAEYPRSRPRAGASGSGKGRVRESWREAGRCPRPVWGLVGGLGRRLAPGVCPLLAPHTVQFIHEPPGPALEGAVEKGLVRGTGEGQRPCWGGGGVLCP